MRMRPSGLARDPPLRMRGHRRQAVWNGRHGPGGFLSRSELGYRMVWVTFSTMNSSVEEFELVTASCGVMLGHHTNREKNYFGQDRREHGSIVLDPKG